MKGKEKIGNRSRRGIGMRRKTAVGIFAVLIAATLIASGALLSYYGKIETTATITQALTLNGQSWDSPIEYTIGSPAGNTYVKGPVSMKNRADSPIPVTFGTTQEWKNTYGNWVDASDAVTVRYFGELILDNKNNCISGGAWSLIPGDGTGGLLKYYLDGSTFDYEFNATGLTSSTDYSLIYYADFEPRFDTWGGNNPGKLIGTFTTDDTGNIALTTGIVNLGMDLPSGADANIDEYDYSGTPDNYTLHHGAKIWLVPTDDLTSGNLPLAMWNPGNYLFETNLISYHDYDDGAGAGFIAYQGITNFWIEYTFEPDAMPGSYRIITEVQPS